MSTDLARMDHNAVAVLGGASDALARLGEWVTAAESAHTLITRLIGTPFVPDTFWPKILDSNGREEQNPTQEQRNGAKAMAVANATAAVLQGVTLGVDPLTALAQIYVIHGRPGMYAKMMVALVQAHGHEVWTEDQSDTRAIVCGRRKGSEHTERVIVTMDMARKAKWTRNEAYEKTPQDMLWARAAARVCDRIASDVLKGITSVEEVRDVFYAQAEVGEGNGRRTVAPPARQPRQPRQQPAQQPALTAAPEEPPLDEPPPRPRERVLVDDTLPPLPRAARYAEPHAQVRQVVDEPALDAYDGEAEAEAASEAAEASQDDDSAPDGDGPEPDADPPAALIPEPPRQPRGITSAQQRRMHTLLGDSGRGDRDLGLVYIAGVIEREIKSTKELTQVEAAKIIYALEIEAGSS